MMPSFLLTVPHARRFVTGLLSPRRARFPTWTVIALAVALLLSAAAPSVAGAQAAPTPSPSAPVYLGLSTRSGPDGIEVLDVAPGSPAELAGLRPGDILLAIAGVALQPTQPLGPQISTLQPDIAVPVILTRDGITRTAILTPRARSGGTATPAPISATAPAGPAPLPSDTPRPGGAWIGFGLVESSDGLRIEKVVDGSPAAVAGLRKDDLITQFDGAAVTSVGQVQAILSGKAPGQVVRITITRAKQPLEFTLTLGQAPTASPPGPTAEPGTPVARPSSAAPTATPEPYGMPTGARVPLGVEYEIVTDATAKARGLTVTEGAYVLRVEPDSPAALSGIQVGDVITEVEGDKVDAKRTLTLRMLPYTAGDTVVLTVIRNGQTLRILVTLSVRGVARGDGRFAAIWPRHF